MFDAEDIGRLLTLIACLSFAACASDDTPRDLVDRHYAALKAQDREMLAEIHVRTDWYDPPTASKLNQQRRSVRVVSEGDLQGPEAMPGDRYVTVAERYGDSEVEHKMNFWFRRIDGRWRIVAFNAEENSDQ